MYTYGQPRTGNAAYAALVTDLIGVTNIFRGTSFELDRAILRPERNTTSSCALRGRVRIILCAYPRCC